jgi:ABC-type antimicrobial peptide transport system permease subunit
VDAILVKVLAGIASVITAGWFISFVVLPFFRPDYQPPPEVTVALTAVITAIAGLLTSAYYKARRALGEDNPEDGSDGDGNDR